MVGINDKFKSLMNQAQQKITEIKKEGSPQELLNKLSNFSTKLDNYNLSSADNQASRNNFKMAIFILEQIPQKSEAYAEAQQKLIKYRNVVATELFQDADNKYHNGRFTEALFSLKRIPETAQIYSQAQIKIVECEKAIKQQELEKQREQEKRLVEQAANYAAGHNFNKAISILEGIRQSSEIYLDVQQKINKYRDSLALCLVQEGIDKYKHGHFVEAIAALKLVPNRTLAYQQAQDKISECEEAIRQQALAKQREQEQQALAKQKEQERLLREKQELIASFKHLVPINYNGKLVAAALVDNLTYLINSVEEKHFLDEINSDSETYANGIFVIVKLTVSNNGKKPQSMFSSMYLVDELEREFSYSVSGKMALYMSGDKTVEIIQSEVQPGLQNNITIVFDIPVEAEDLKLKIPNGLFGKPVILPLSLAL
jgi:hypothetical protein